MQRLEVFLHWGDEEEIPVGVLATRDHALYFEYAATFLADPLPISPFKLPVQSGIIEHSGAVAAAIPIPLRPASAYSWRMASMGLRRAARRAG
jgi:hypothetical protein